MSVFEIVILGLALAMDAFAVTISNSFAYPKISRTRSLSMPLAFGFFQFLMPVVGFVLGQLVSDFITQFAGIITFAILGFIGGKMIWDAFHEEEGEEASEQTLTMPVLLFQAVATSIDPWRRRKLCRPGSKRTHLFGHHRHHYGTYLHRCPNYRQALR